MSVVESAGSVVVDEAMWAWCADFRGDGVEYSGFG